MKLVISSVLGLVLGGCSTGAEIPEQITSLNVGCKSADVQVTNMQVQLSGEQSWTAKCGGKTYYCTYLPESGSDCYEVKE